MAGDYGSIQARIADEITRSDLTSQIKLAILSAVAFYSRKNFYFNETRSDTFSTVASQEFYTSSDAAFIATMYEIESIVLTLSTSWRFPLQRQAWETLEEWSINSTLTSSQPESYAYYGQQLRLYPIPNGVYSCRVSGTKLLTPSPLSADADTNAWMTDAEELIRARAKADININVIRDPDALAMAVRMSDQGKWFLDAMEQSAYIALKEDTIGRLSTGRFVPTQF